MYTGCYWGDDIGWKLQCVDLSNIQNGVLKTDARFGYIEVSTNLSHMSYFDHKINFDMPIEADISTGKLYTNAFNLKWGEEQES